MGGIQGRAGLLRAQGNPSLDHSQPVGSSRSGPAIAPSGGVAGSRGLSLGTTNGGRGGLLDRLGLQRLQLHRRLVVMDVGLAVMLPLEVDVRVMGMGELTVVVLVGMARAEVVEAGRQVVVVVRHVVVNVGVDNPLVVVLLPRLRDRVLAHRNLLRSVPDRTPAISFSIPGSVPRRSSRGRYSRSMTAWERRCSRVRTDPLCSQSRPALGGTEPLCRMGETPGLEPLGPWPRGGAALRSPDAVARAPEPGYSALQAGCTRRTPGTDRPSTSRFSCA